MNYIIKYTDGTYQSPFGGRTHSRERAHRFISEQEAMFFVDECISYSVEIYTRNHIGFRA
jgi:hypothetical protein